jgi:acetyl esterase/lipase
LLFVPAPAFPLLIVAIVLGEWGHYASLAALVFAGLVWRRTPVAAILALATALVCLTPAMRATKIGRTLPERCTYAFGASSPERGARAPFRLLNLFRRVPTEGVKVSEHLYATAGSKQLKLDLYQSERATDSQPIILIVHGGSWVRGSKEELTAINRYLARAGYAVASINYRFAPEFPFPAAVDDSFTALAFLKAHAAEFHLNVKRIAVIGRSAGGQIALSVAYAGREPGIRGVVAFYPPTDLVLGYANPSPRWILDSKKVLEDYLGGTPAEEPAEYATASPINFVNANTPPTLLIHGGMDSVVWPVHSELLNTRLQQAGRPHLYLSLGWATHGCDANVSGPSGQLSLYAIDRFLAAVLR